MSIETYRLQVGGHSRLIKPADPTKLCKPLVENELQFYKTVENFGSNPSAPSTWNILKNFIPGYHGTCEFHLKATSKSFYQDQLSDTFSDLAGKRSIKFGLESESKSSKASLDPYKIEQNSMNLEIRETPSIAYQADKTKIEGNETNNVSQLETHSSEVYERLRYIVLDDLLHNFKKPCVIDFKMGQRQRKLGATKDKEKRQLEKSITSTSNTLSFRLCGYLSYDKRFDKFCYRDKYWGRTIKEEKVSRVIYRWFWNGYEYYYDLMDQLCKKLKIFYNCVSELSHYRFWSSSLLWFFDGGLNDRELLRSSLDIRMIDFANLNYIEENYEPDKEYLCGLNNLIKILETLMFKSIMSSRVPRSLYPGPIIMSKKSLRINYKKPIKPVKLNYSPSKFVMQQISRKPIRSINFAYRSFYFNRFLSSFHHALLGKHCKILKTK